MNDQSSKSTNTNIPTNTLDEQLAREVCEWENGTFLKAKWIESPEAVPRSGESKAISIRLPVKMLEILKLFAEKKGIGYQVLIKQWLDERIRQERDRMYGDIKIVQPAGPRYAPPVEGLTDRAQIDGPHYEWVT